MGPSRARLLLFAITLNVSATMDLSITGDAGISCREVSGGQETAGGQLPARARACSLAVRDAARRGAELSLACVLRRTGRSRRIDDFYLQFGGNTILAQLRSPSFSETLHATVRLTQLNGSIKCEATNSKGGNRFVTDLHYYVPAEFNLSSTRPASAPAPSHELTSDAAEATPATPIISTSPTPSTLTANHWLTSEAPVAATPTISTSLAPSAQTPSYLLTSEASVAATPTISTSPAPSTLTPSHWLTSEVPVAATTPTPTMSNDSPAPAPAPGHWLTSDAPDSPEAATPTTDLSAAGSNSYRWLIPTLSTVLIVFVVASLAACAWRRGGGAGSRGGRGGRAPPPPVLAPAQLQAAADLMLKVVSVDSDPGHGVNPEGHAQIPKVRIEKRKLSDIVVEFPQFECASEYVMRSDPRWELDRRRLTLGGLLGEGEFGRVLQGSYSTEDSNGATITTAVAVKMLKEDHSDADMVALVSESEVMKSVGRHEHVLALLGCCARAGPFALVVELAALGCLRDFLRKHKPGSSGQVKSMECQPLTPEDLIQFALQVASGMEHLAARGCIHRDLAARNVLVSSGRVLKVADFGMARGGGAGAPYYRKRGAGKLPLRWMAPESILNNYYTTESDVWSFGVLFWEVLTYGSTPYKDVPANDLYGHLREGRRLQRPSGCSEQVYQLMQHCGAFNPDERPTFSQLREMLAAILTDTETTSSS